VQLCTISGTVWSFLEGVKTTGSPLPRSAIVNRCVKDTALLTTICQIARSALTLLSVDGEKKPKTAVITGADRILSFFTATVIEFADKRALDDPQLRALYPFLLEGLKKSTEGMSDDRGTKMIYRAGGPADQWRRSSCMIIAQICRKTRLAKPLLKSVVGALMYAFVHVSGVSSGGGGSSVVITQGTAGFLAAMEIITIVSVIAQSQKVLMGPKMVMAIFSDISESSNSTRLEEGQSSNSRVGSAYLLQCVEILQKERGLDATPLLKVITATLTSALIAPVSIEDKNDLSTFLSPTMASKILTYCIASGMLADSTVAGIVWKILQNNTSLGNLGDSLKASVSTRKERAQSFSDDNDGERKEVLRVLRCVSQRYSSIFDACVQAAYKAVRTDTEVNGDEDEMMSIKNGDDKDDVDDDDIQIGPTTDEMNMEKQAKASSLRRLLTDTFTDAPYRMPSNSGVSLLLSLTNSSPLIRINALETFAATVPKGTCDLVYIYIHI
jgi:hypothetical protein